MMRLLAFALHAQAALPASLARTEESTVSAAVGMTASASTAMES